MRLLVHGRLEEAELVPALDLGAVEGELGVLEQRVRILPVLREQGDADAGRGLDLLAVDVEWFGHRRQDLVGQGDNLGGLADLRLHERELVATEPGQRVAGADRCGDPLGDGAQQLVADWVAQGVVDVLEAVEIEQQDRDHAAFAAGTGQLLAEPIVQQGAVRQAGEQVVQGQTPDHLCAELERGVTDRAQAQPIDAIDQHGSRAEG